MSVNKQRLLTLSGYLVGLAAMMLQACTETKETDCSKLCGNWVSVQGKPDVLIYREGDAYKVTVFKRSGIRRKPKPETYLLREEEGNLFINTGYRIDIAYKRGDGRADLLAARRLHPRERKTITTAKSIG